MVGGESGDQGALGQDYEIVSHPPWDIADQLGRRSEVQSANVDMAFSGSLLGLDLVQPSSCRHVN
jgi:hypothetical protein